MNIKKMLNEHKEKKSKLDIMLSTIDAWEHAVKNPETIVYLVQTSGIELGMPRGSFNINSPVEKEVINKIEDFKLAIELVREWIKEEESRAFPLKIDVMRVEHSLNSLANDEVYIIECKHFENLIWRDIELNYNNKYTRKNNYITESGLRKKYDDIIKKLYNVLKPF